MSTTTEVDTSDLRDYLERNYVNSWRGITGHKLPEGFDMTGNGDGTYTVQCERCGSHGTAYVETVDYGTGTNSFTRHTVDWTRDCDGRHADSAGEYLDAIGAPTTFSEAERLLSVKHGDNSFKKLYNNTYLEKRSNGDIAVKLHNTDVVTFHEDGSMTLDSGGWRTVTTKDRINMHLPYGMQVFADHGRWFVVRGDVPSPYWRNLRPNHYARFRDGFRVGPLGGIRDQHVDSDGAETDVLRSEARDYIVSYMEAYKAGDVEPFGYGNCRACNASVRDRRFDSRSDLSHLRQHIERGEYPAALLHAALMESHSDRLQYGSRTGDLWRRWLFELANGKDHYGIELRCKSALGRFLSTRLGFTDFRWSR